MKNIIIIILLTLFSSSLNAQTTKLSEKPKGELDYAKQELKLILTQLDRTEYPAGKISKKGTIHFKLPEFDLKKEYDKVGFANNALNVLLEMGTCNNQDPFKNPYNDIYSYKYDISVKKYGLPVAGLKAVSNKNVLKNNQYSADTLYTGSNYYWFYVDRDVTFKYDCINLQNGKEISQTANMKLKKGWNFIEETLTEKQQFSRNDYTGDMPKTITYSIANPSDKNIKWYIVQYATDNELKLIKNLEEATPLTQKEIEANIPQQINELPLLKQEYGVTTPNNESKNKNAVHLIYGDDSQKKEIEIYFIDSAKHPEDILMVNMVYDMEAEYGESDNTKPYVAQYNTQEKTSKLLYKINDRYIVNAIGLNIKPEAMWKHIQEFCKIKCKK